MSTQLIHGHDTETTYVSISAEGRQRWTRRLLFSARHCSTVWTDQSIYLPPADGRRVASPCWRPRIKPRHTRVQVLGRACFQRLGGPQEHDCRATGGSVQFCEKPPACSGSLRGDEHALELTAVVSPRWSRRVSALTDHCTVFFQRANPVACALRLNKVISFKTPQPWLTARRAAENWGSESSGKGQMARRPGPCPLGPW